MMGLSPGGKRKLKQVHRSESARSLGELMVLVRGRSQAFPGGSLALSLTEQLTPHLCLASRISQEQNFHLALDAGQEAGPASGLAAGSWPSAETGPHPTRRASLSYWGWGWGKPLCVAGQGAINWAGRL